MPPIHITVQWFSIQTLVNSQWKLSSRKWTPSGPGAGVLQISRDRDDRIGAKIKNQKHPWGFKQTPQNSLDQNLTPKKSHAEFLSHKNFQRNYTDGMRRNYHESSDRFEYSKKIPTEIKLPPKILAHNLNPKKNLRSSLSHTEM